VTATTLLAAGGPFFDDVAVGDTFESAGLTLSAGEAAVHRSIVGDALALSKDAELCRRVTGTEVPVVQPALVWDVAVGQSSVATQRGLANVFTRGLTMLRPVHVGDTLRTTTSIVALRQSSSKPTGLALLRIETRDQHDRPVLRLWRCGMLPLRSAGVRTGHGDDVGAVAGDVDPVAATAHVTTWDLAAFASAVDGPRANDLAIGDRWEVAGGDVVSSAPELARLTGNVASAHHDRTATATGSRLVYGGHTIGVALAQTGRALPSIVAVAGWRECQNTGPVREGDTLFTKVEIESIAPLTAAAALIDLHVVTTTVRHGQPAHAPALDWHCTVVVA
jgi:acyl dehydratase